MKKILLIIGVCLGLAGQIMAAQSQTGAEHKMGGMLAKTFRAFQADTVVKKISATEYKQRYGSKFFPVDDQGRMYLSITVSGDIDTVVNEITALGGIVHGHGKITIYAWIPMDKLADISALSGVGEIDGVGYAGSRTGNVTSAGDHLLLADSARSVFYANGATVGGTPIKVGVISSGMQYYINSEQSGDLPAVGWVSSHGFDSRNYSDAEGTAMMEIIHDLAPGASLTFGAVGTDPIDNYSSTPLDMANVINTMSTSAGCKVIVDDIGWNYGEPWFSDGDIASAIYSFQQYQTGNVYVSAAGNDAQYMYVGKPSFSITGTKHWVQFNGIDTSLTLTINGYSDFFIGLQWDDPWGNASADYNLYLYDGGWNLVDSSATPLGVVPQEWLDHPMNGGSGTFHIMVEDRTQSTKNIKVGVFPGNVVNTTSYTLSYKSTTGQVYGHSAATGCISVAAYDALSGSIESFSSRGPSLMFTGGNPGNEQNRNTPVITATDHVATKVGKDGHFGTDSLFSGTSAAAPHVAAIAALYYSRYPSNTASQFISAITSSAKSIGGGTGGTWNYTSGYGKVSAYDALASGLTTLNSPHVTSNTSWDLNRITGTATVDAGVTITIDAYCTTEIDGTVNFGTNAKILYYGTLILGSGAVLNPSTALVQGSGGRLIGGSTITLTQLDESENPFGYVGRWNTVKFDSSMAPYPFVSLSGNVERVRAQQYFKSGTTQKFQLWNNTNSRVFDPDTFKTSAGQPSILAAQFKTANNATLQSQLLEGGSPGGTLNFLDPWMIDTTDSYGPRNKGMSDWARPVGYSSNNLGTSTQHQGVLLNQNPNFLSGVPVYTASAPSTQTIGSYTGIFQNWSANSGGAHFQNANSTTTAVVFDATGATVTANYKGIHLSNNASTFSNNSQRKLVRTGNGWLHQVYESMGHVWYEVSTDGGTTWALQSPTDSTIGGVVFQGTPGHLDVGGGKCPSIDYCHTQFDSSSIVITFQQVSGNYYTIIDMTYAMINNQWIVQTFPVTLYTEPSNGDQYATTNANPNIVWGGDGHGMLLWERKTRLPNYPPGINYRLGMLNVNGGLGPEPYPDSITGTDRNSVNATISSYHFPNGSQYFDIAWEQDVNSTRSSIKYASLDSINNGNPFTQSVVQTLSNSSFNKNYNPSIVDPPDGNSVQCAWIGDVDGSGTWMNVSALELTIGSTTIQRNSAGVQSVSMNTDNASNYYVAWSQNINNGNWSNRVWGNVPVNSLNTSGQAVQLCNGRVNSKMVVSSFYNSALPYYFQTSNSIGNLQKSDASSGGRGRGVAVEKGDAGFYYSIGDLTLDGNAIDFVGANKKTNYDSLAAINTVILSQPFTLTNNSVLTFSESSGASDTSAAGKALGAKGNLSFTIQLVDAISGSVIGTARQLNLGASNLQAYKVTAYTLPTTGLGGKTGQLKVTVGTNVAGLHFALVEQYQGVNANALGKATVQQLTLQRPDVVTQYGLDQNYPNPFNPATTISYQIPKDGHVTIKIFDAIGREVTTLVDEFKPSGRYSVKFDASRFSSGIYFYSIRSGSYNAVKKMSLIK